MQILVVQIYLTLTAEHLICLSLSSAYSAITIHTSSSQEMQFLCLVFILDNQTEDLKIQLNTELVWTKFI